MRIKISFIELFLLFGFAILFNILEIRICPFYYFFKIPCPGCGLTRSFIELLKGNLIESLRYNILGILLSISFIIYLLFIYLKLDKLFKLYIKKNFIIIILISLVLLVLVELININNKILY